MRSKVRTPPVVVALVGLLYLLAAASVAIESVGTGGDMLAWMEIVLLAVLGGGLLAQRRWAWIAELAMCWVQLAAAAALACFMVLKAGEPPVPPVMGSILLIVTLVLLVVLNAALIAYLLRSNVRQGFL